MARVVRELRAGGSADKVVRQLRKQEEASRRGGFAGIARLCGAMDDYLAETRRGEPPGLSEAATTLLDICRIIELHAEAVAKDPINGNSDEVHPRDNGNDAGRLTGGAAEEMCRPGLSSPPGTSQDRPLQRADSA